MFLNVVKIQLIFMICQTVLVVLKCFRTDISCNVLDSFSFLLIHIIFALM